MQRLRTYFGPVHNRPLPDYNAYKEVRLLLADTPTGIATRVGMTMRSWCKRERKEAYRADELIGLYRLSRLSPANFLKLLEKCR